MTKKAVTLEIPELIQFLVQELHDLPDDRKPGNNTKYQVEDAKDKAASNLEGAQEGTATMWERVKEGTC